MHTTWMSSIGAPSLRVAPKYVENDIIAKRNGSMSHGVSANIPAITTAAQSASPSAIRNATALRMDIIGPAPTSSHTM